ncbi:AAA family ATPase [Flavobacterium litorale]|uniref:AAA family ATPase n=1 Tax=Flavobacterium litorale TaxID=2856519 RepID=A0ABX8V564_9FLAO|nr:AAA family ATPase [Flavobacterium litorale]QYJ67983.1 AAA family ATPase [Flavobacterium litorale]
MIKKIQTINDFGVYKDFNWGKISNFKKKNILYGWNYSGKTTLSRLFECLRDKKVHPHFENSQFKIIVEENTEINQNNIDTSNEKILIYNSDYILENLRWDLDNKINGITFDVGEKILVREKIQKNKLTISKINGNENESGRKEIYLNALHNFYPFEEYKFSNEAKKIKNDIFNSLIDFDKRHYKKIKNEVISNLNEHILDNEKLIYCKKVSIASNNKDKIGLIDYDINLNSIIISVNNVLAHELDPENIIEIFSTSVQSWLKEGILLHENENNCLFCGNNLSNIRKKTLNDYLSSEVSKLRDRTSSLILEIEDEIQKINEIKLPKSKNDFFESYQRDYNLQLENLNQYIPKIIDYFKLLIDKLKEKESNKIFKSITVHSLESEIINEFKISILAINNIINDNNDLIDNFIDIQNDSRLLVKKHYVADYLIEEDYLIKEKKKDFAMRCLERYEKLVKKLEENNYDLESELKSITLGRKEFNDFINKFLNRDDIKIEVSEDEKFILKRGNVIAQNFSEGEKTAISFSYFLVTLQSLFKKNELFEYIIFIDDPISSLDINHITQVYSIINSFFFRKGIDENNSEKIVECFKQLFISTHNSDFFAFLKDSNRINKKKKIDGYQQPTSEYYLIQKVSKSASEIKPLPKSLKNHKSEYLYLFELIFGFHSSLDKENDERLILLPNAIRRFLEIYTLMKLPSSTDEVDNRLKILFPEYSELKTLHHFSHFTNLDKVTKHDSLIMNLPQAIDELINILEKDEIHFNSLKSGFNLN